MRQARGRPPKLFLKFPAGIAVTHAPGDVVSRCHSFPCFPLRAWAFPTAVSFIYPIFQPVPSFPIQTLKGRPTAPQMRPGRLATACQTFFFSSGEWRSSLTENERSTFSSLPFPPFFFPVLASPALRRNPVAVVLLCIGPICVWRPPRVAPGLNRATVRWLREGQSQTMLN